MVTEFAVASIHRIFKDENHTQMITFVVAQLFLVCISLSFPTLTMYHYANGAAQVALLFHNIFPYKRIRYLSIVLLGAAALSSSMAWLICAVRTWRYIFFPTKEDAAFFGECIANVVSILIQLVIMLSQAKELRMKGKVQYIDTLFRTCVYILFFHDFAYAGFFTYSDDTTQVFGYTQFIVHTLMLGLNKMNVELFQYVWVALLVQHVYVLVMYDDIYVRIFTSVYIVADVIYLINSSLQHQTSIVTRSIKLILGPEESRVE